MSFGSSTGPANDSASGDLMLHVACSSDSRLVGDCAVMLLSLTTVNRASDVHVHFLHDDRLAHRDLSDLGAMVRSTGAGWHPIEVPEDATVMFPYTERYGYSAWYRILLPEVLNELDRVLYLDSDLLIVDDLRPLFDVALGDACLAAVTQPTLPSMLSRLQVTLGLPDADSYFNSGVMTLDLDRLRAGRYIGQVLAFIADERGPMPWADQDPLNAVLHRLRLHLGPRWNLMTPVFELQHDVLPWTADEIAHAVAAPAIVHFIGPYKPWHYRCRHPYRAQYFEYLSSTPWSDRPIEGRTVKNMFLRPWPPRWQTRWETALDRGATKARVTARRVRTASGGRSRRP